MPMPLGRFWGPTRTHELGRLVLGVALAVTLASAEPCLAGDGAEPVVVVRGGDELFASRIAAEGSLVGLRVTRDAGDDRSDEATLARAGVVAIVDLRDPGRPRLLYRDDTGAISARPVGEAGRNDTTAVVIVEAVRGALLELELIEEPEPSPEGVRPEHAGGGEAIVAAREEADIVDPSADDRRDAPTTSPGSVARLWISLGPAGALASGGMGPSAHGAFGLAVEPGTGLRVGAAAWIPVATQEWTEGRATAEATSTLYLAEGGYALYASPTLDVNAGVGAGLLSLSVQGELASASGERLEAGPHDLLAGLGFVHAGAAIAFTPWLRLRAAALFGMSAPRPVVEIEDQRSATWGRLFGGLTLSAEVGVALWSGEGVP